MKAIVFAAGMGTRLKPFTDEHPKALLPLQGKPLLWFAIEKLKQAGIDEITVNVHHFAEQIVQYLKRNNFGVTIHISNETNELLDTGGALLKARQWLDGKEPFVAYNVDIFSSIDLKKLIKFHLEQRALATVAVRKRETSRYFLFSPEMVLMGWENTDTGEMMTVTPNVDYAARWAFSGIQVISPSIFSHISETGKFSLTPMYLRLAQNHNIVGYPDNSQYWLDVGKMGQVEIAEKWLASSPKSFR
jgi:NDP-sugar pyrophosphorylase family protein